jgi:hypothetical protein
MVRARMQKAGDTCPGFLSSRESTESRAYCSLFCLSPPPIFFCGAPSVKLRPLFVQVF